jgi:hypothetical protein
MGRDDQNFFSMLLHSLYFGPQSSRLLEVFHIGISFQLTVDMVTVRTPDPKRSLQKFRLIGKES